MCNDDVVLQLNAFIDLILFNKNRNVSGALSDFLVLLLVVLLLIFFSATFWFCLPFAAPHHYNCRCEWL